MPRRKKRFLMLKSRFGGNLIVVSRYWYDTARTPELGGMRYNRRWKIMAQHDDESVLITMAKLGDNYVGMQVNHTHEDEKGNITNVRS
jgi:hypothetical protein